MRNIAISKMSDFNVTVRCDATGQIVPKMMALPFVRPVNSAKNSASSEKSGWLPDFSGRIKGEKRWLAPDPLALKAAQDSNLIGTPPLAGDSNSLNNKLSGWRGLLDALLLKRILDAVSMARRSGKSLCGEFKVRHAIKKMISSNNYFFLLFSAKEISSAAINKMVQSKVYTYPYQLLMNYCFTNDGESSIQANAMIHVPSTLSAKEIGQAFGRDHVVHAVVSDEGLLGRIVCDSARLMSLRRVNLGSEA